MEIVKTEIYVPEERKVTINVRVPDSIPVGQAEVIVIIQPKNNGYYSGLHKGITTGECWGGPSGPLGIVQ